MSSAHENHVEFRSTLGKFTLEAVFTVPATGITMLFGRRVAARRRCCDVSPA